ncbi:hypothetical protein ACFW9U_28655 [Rhodococcus aetherivorans]|uniref:hypothetical protein n=1 Tax=Rhodococcus aetherivorans TaxID=191292 RepID=UPI00367149F9
MVSSPTVKIEENTSAEWEKFSATLDVVPDPMVLRTAELFLNGRSGVVAHGLNPDVVWDTIDKNLHGLLSFYDALLTRERLPLIQYWETFASPRRPLVDLLGPLAVPVEIASSVYESAKENLIDKLIAQQPLDKLPEEMINDVVEELGAFAYDWHPSLPGLQYGRGEHQQVAEFLIGGMVFGSYAQATGTDHLIQTKRSRLLVALSVPEPRLSKWRYEQEQELFADFKQHCTAEGDNVRADDFDAAPTVLPYLLLQKPPPTGTMDLLERCLQLREEKLGRDYRDWYGRLRRGWSLGRDDPQAEKSISAVLKSLRERMPDDDVKTGGLTLSIGMQGPVPSAMVEGVPLRWPRWLRLWVVDHFVMKPHRHLLLRMSLSQRRYRDVTLDLHRLWSRS